MEGVDIEPWARACTAAGVKFQTARPFTFEGVPPPCVRLGFAAVTEARIRTAVKTMAELAPAHSLPVAARRARRRA